MYSEKERSFIEKRNLENMVETYREELLKVLKGEHCINLIPRSVRKKMSMDGVLTKFGYKYEVTPLGKKMLNKEVDT